MVPKHPAEVFGYPIGARSAKTKSFHLVRIVEAGAVEPATYPHMTVERKWGVFPQFENFVDRL